MRAAQPSFQSVVLTRPSLLPLSPTHSYVPLVGGSSAPVKKEATPKKVRNGAMKRDRASEEKKCARATLVGPLAPATRQPPPACRPSTPSMGA